MMKRSLTPNRLLTHEEMDALMAIDMQEQTRHASNEVDAAQVSSTNSWFWLRNLVLFSVVVAYCVKLTFFTHLVVGNFESSVLDPHRLIQYAQFRVFLMLSLTLAYLYSYLKDWHFQAVSVLFVGVASGALLLDYLFVYAHLSHATRWLTGLMALRVLTLLCLLFNAIHARRAPAMPRHLWS